MPTPPYAKLLVSRNGGAATFGGIIAAFGDAIQLSSEDVSHPYAFKFEIYEYPAGFTCPAGWSTAADGRTYYYASGPTPPSFTLPASHGTWGDFLLRLTINNGDPSSTGLPKEQFIDEATALRLVSDSGLTDTAFGVGAQFNPLGAIGDLKADLRIIAAGLGSGFGTGSIADHAVTLPKLLQINTSSVLGRASASTGNVEVLTVSGGLETAAGVIQRSALTGDVTAPAGSNTTTIAANVVDFSKESQIGVGLVGNDTGTANRKLIGLGPSFGFSGGNLILAAAGIALSMFANIAAHTFLGNNTAGAAAPVALTATQLTAELNVATTTLKGLVPAPGTATGKVLRDDLTWATVSGTFISPATPADDNKIGYANAGANGWRAGVTTPNVNQLAFAAETTNSNLRIEHNTVLVSARDSGNTTYNGILFWGASADVLQLGTAPGGVDKVAEIRHKATLTTFQVAGATAFSISGQASSFTGQSSTGTVGSAFKVTDAAHTALTASTERNSVLFDLGQTRTWATGAIASQRSFRVIAPTVAFSGASTVTTAATMAVSGAPTAGTNATLTQALALWIEAGAIGFGSNAALSGLTRFATGAVVMAGRSSTSTDINLIRWGSTATDELALGDDGAASVLVSAAATFSVRLGGAVELILSTTQLDLKNNAIVNALSLNGTRVANGTLGSPLTDADQVLSIDGGSVYEQITAPTANRTKRLSNTGTGLADKHVVSIRRHTTDSNTLTIADEAGNQLYQFPAGAKGQADFRFNSGTSKFEHIGHIPLS